MRAIITRLQADSMSALFEASVKEKKTVRVAENCPPLLQRGVLQNCIRIPVLIRPCEDLPVRPPLSQLRAVIHK